MLNTKHLINGLQTSVTDNLHGLVVSRDDLQLVADCNSVVRKDYKSYVQSGKVLLISGGGAGHEPMFAGFVGSGLLTAAISGDCFASPPTRRIIKLIETLVENDCKSEILFIVANYTGDRLNFGLAREHLALKGYKIDMLIFGEDVAFYGEGKRAGRRGLAGVTLIHKIAGSLAEQGLNLAEIKERLTGYSQQIGTISISLSSCNIPGTGSSFTLASDEIELGLGVHGEAGVQRLKLCTASEAVKVMLSHLFGQSSVLSEPIARYNKKVVIVINNTGGLSQFELNIVVKEVVIQSQALGLSVERIYIGSFMTSFSMSGVSVSAMAVDTKILKLLDDKASSSAWTQIPSEPKVVNSSVHLSNGKRVSEEILDYDSIDGLKFGRQLFIRCVELSCKALISSERYLNDLDTELGDGDCGSTLSNASKSILKLIMEGKLKPSFFQMSHVIQDNMGGTSGAIYSLMLTAASQAIKKFVPKINGKSYDAISLWADVLQYSIETISRYSSAKPGDRTMLDPLNSALEALVKCDHSLPYHLIAGSVSLSAIKGAESTAMMTASVGRASYVNRGQITRPDPGAMAVAEWLKAIAHAFDEQV